MKTAKAPVAILMMAANLSAVGSSIAIARSSAGQVTVPNTFTAGAPARAAEVNANFEAIASAINDSAAVLASSVVRLDALEAGTTTADLAPAGNLLLGLSTPTAGNVLKDAAPFIHNYGRNNTFIGLGAGNFTMTGAGNTANGAGALASNDSGLENTANGIGALGSNTSGAHNTAIGASAMAGNLVGQANTAAGWNALSLNIDGDANTAIGSLALAANTTGDQNAAVGWNALASNTTGQRNTAAGSAALAENVTGHGNTAIGHRALQNNTTDGNTALGAQALAGNTTGQSNTASGLDALRLNTTGVGNTALGRNALFSNTAASGNTAVGVGALQSSTGPSNTAVGQLALNNMTTGSRNIAVGAAAGALITTGSNNIDIGHAGDANDSDTLRIGTAQSRAFMAGIRGVTTANANAVAVVVDSAGQLGTLSSSRTVKDEIADMDEASSVLLRLRPVTFHYRSDRSPDGRTLHYGLIAEEVAEIAPGLVARSADGETETVYYQFLPPMLLNEYQKQHRTIAALEARVAELEVRVRELAGHAP
jgi:hypothetical protein